MNDNNGLQKNDKDRPLPPPDVVVAKTSTPPGAAAVKGILVNPIYTGVGPYPRLVSDEEWVRACAKLIETDGPVQFLVNLLHVLRESLPPETPAN